MPNGYRGRTRLPEWLTLPIVLIIIAFVGYVIIKALVEVEPGFADYGWYLYGIMITAIALFTAYSWLQKLRPWK